MPIYRPITDVMPVASMVTGAAVTAALGDQIRDNLVALYDGWWFKATRITDATMPSSVVTAIPLDTMARSRSATDDQTISIANGGAIRVTKTGLWMLGFHFRFSSAFTGVADMFIDATDATGSQLCEQANDSGSSKAAMCCSGTVNVTTSPQTFTPNLYTVGAPTVTANTVVFWGYWLGDNP
jgi:hypothetical protein